MAVLAWLLLVFQSILAVPLHAGAGVGADARAGVAMAHPMPAGHMAGSDRHVAEAMDCCAGGDTHGAMSPCGCASMCTSLLLFEPLTGVASLVPMHRFPAAGMPHAPTRYQMPPFRPPLA